MKSVACLLLLALASCDLTPPKLETGGWKPVLGRQRAATPRGPPDVSPSKKRDRFGFAHDIPALYVWLPTEILDHIDRGRVGHARPRPNYLPLQNLPTVGTIPSSPHYPPFQNAFPPRLHGPPPEDFGTPLDYGAPTARPLPDLGDHRDLPKYSPPDVPSGYDVPGAVSPPIGKTPEEPSKTTGQRNSRTGYGTPPSYPTSEPQSPVPDAPAAPEDYQDERQPATTPVTPYPERPQGDPEEAQLDPRSRAEGSCSPVISAAAAVTNLGNRSLRQVADSVGAGAFFDRVDLAEDVVYSLATAPLTLFLPSDESLERTSPLLLDSWRSDKEALRKALANHVLPNRVTLEQLTAGPTFTTASNALLTVHSHPNGVVTVNGQRLVRADVSGPHGSIVHVLGGPLTPKADRDIATTVTECGKYEGFLTLAGGTGVIDLLKEGQATLFLPSNDALSKIPPEELKLYHSNATALKEFLMYHIAEGAHYSHDLRDGQYLRSLQNGQPIRVSVNVDGCNRRLYEANNSPLYRADIPASNGVIHVIDWVLLPKDHKWCRDVILP